MAWGFLQTSPESSKNTDPTASLSNLLYTELSLQGKRFPFVYKVESFCFSLDTHTLILQPGSVAESMVPFSQWLAQRQKGALRCLPFSSKKQSCLSGFPCQAHSPYSTSSSGFKAKKVPPLISEIYNLKQTTVLGERYCVRCLYKPVTASLVRQYQQGSHHFHFRMLTIVGLGYLVQGPFNNEKGYGKKKVFMDRGNFGWTGHKFIKLFWSDE